MLLVLILTCIIFALLLKLMSERWQKQRLFWIVFQKKKKNIMFSVGNLNPSAQHHQAQQQASQQRRHQTLIFWDYESIHPHTAMTAAHLYRKLKDHLKEKSVATGSLHCKAFTPTVTNRLALDQLEDLQITVVSASSRLQLQSEMAQALSNVGAHHNPTEIAVVVVTQEKCYVRDIKQLADNGFEVYVVHDAPSGSPEADILETYATRSFLLKDVIGVTSDGATSSIHNNTAPSSSAIAGGHTGSANSGPKGLAGTAGLTVLVEGRRVSLDDLERNDAVAYAIRHPTPVGIRWCTQGAASNHNVQECPFAHPAVASPAAAGSASHAPPTYTQAVQLLGKSPIMSPAGVNAPPPPAGTSPLMAFHHPPQGSHSMPAYAAMSHHQHVNAVLHHHHHHHAMHPHPRHPVPHHLHSHGQHSHHQLPPPSIPVMQQRASQQPPPSRQPPPQGTTHAMSLWGDAPSSQTVDEPGESSSHYAQMEALLSKLTAGPTTPPGGHPTGQRAAGHDDPMATVDMFSSLTSRLSSIAHDPVGVSSPPIAPVSGGPTAAPLRQSAPPSRDGTSDEPMDIGAKISAVGAPAAISSGVWGGRHGGVGAAEKSEPPPTADLPTLESLSASPGSRKSGAPHHAPPSGPPVAVGAKGGAGPKLSFASIVGANAASSTSPASSSSKQPSSAAAAGKARQSSVTTTPPAAAARPKEFIIDGHAVPMENLVRNKFVETCLRDNTNVGRFCTDHRAHAMMDCPYAHRDKYSLLQGGEVEGRLLLTNKALENLRANTTYKGNFCTSPKPHDPLKCTYLHRKPGGGGGH